MEHTTNTRRNKAVRWLASGAAVVGIGIGAAGLASAATNDSGSSTSTASTSQSTGTGQSSTSQSGNTGTPPTGGSQVDPASLPNGPGETVLTGDTLTQVTAAAKAAEPGATVIRAETDSSGHAYEVHMKLADGSVKTLYFTKAFAADGSDTGFGSPAGHKGQAPAAPSATSNG